MTEVSVTPFKFKHFPLLLDMLRSQNYLQIDTITYRTLPKIGYLAMIDGKIPVAAGFLRKLEPCYGQIDTLVSYAHYGSIIRHYGITKVVDSLMADAKKQHMQGILALTEDPSVVKRAKEIGFNIIPQLLIGTQL